MCKIFISDHFLSHTLVTMLLAWLIILFITLSITKGKLDEKSTTI
jgi:membrane-associated PAP2 superfamily phosphatase